MSTINIMDYGAVADGVTDDTAAFASALAALSNGGILDVPAGEYLVSSDGSVPSIDTCDDLWVRGEGKGVTKFKQADGSNQAVIAANVVNNVRISDLTIDGNKANQTLGHGIRVGEINGLLIENVEIKNTKGYGIGLQEETIKNTYIHNVYIYDPGMDGIDYKNTTNDNMNNKLHNIYVYNPGIAGVDIRGVVQASHIYVHGLGADTVGIRYREWGSTTGEGGSLSSLSNFYVESTAGVTSNVGLYIAANWTATGNGTIIGTGLGVHLVGTHNKVTGVTAKDTRSSAFYVDTAASYSGIVNCEARGAVDYGFDIAGDYCRLDSNEATSNSNAGLRIQSSADKTVVVGNLFRSNGAANIKSGTNITQTGNEGY